MSGQIKKTKATPAPHLRSRAAPIIERAPLPSLEVQGSAHVVSYVNSAFCSLLGKTREELIGKSFAEIVPGGDKCVPVLDKVYQTGEAATLAQEADSEPNPTHWLYAIWPALNANERPVGVIIQLRKATDFRQHATAINEALLIAGLRQHQLAEVAERLNAQLKGEITERERTQSALQAAKDLLAAQAADLEVLVAERTEKLRETVGELEAFSYSVAHDMRAPLRGMQGYAQILLQEHASQLDAVARPYLERIANSASRMDVLIQDVLDYTRVVQADTQLKPVDLDRLVRDVVAIYPGWQPPLAAVHVQGSLPPVLGHEGFLTQCVSNLIGNAVKFVGRNATPVVRIWAESANSGVRVWFEDNGIGIAPKDHKRVFRMFEQINSRNEFEGTGMGLTIARKAAERMGGKIGFESELGKGSKFWIELPKAPPP